MNELPHSPTESRWFSDRTAAIIILLAGIAAHASALTRGFVWDDVKTLDYMKVTGLWAVGTADPFGFFRPGKIVLFSAAQTLFGDRVWLWNLTAMTVMLASGVLLYGLLRRWLVPVAALAGALIYTVHPHHVQSTFWLSSLNGAVLTMLGIVYYRAVLRWNDSMPPAAHLAIALSYLAALAMKEEAVTFSLIAGLMLLSLGQRPSRGWLASTAVLWAVSLVFVVYARMISSQAGQSLGSSLPDWLLSLSAPRTILAHFLYFIAPFRWYFGFNFSLEPVHVYGFMTAGWLAAAAGGVWLARGGGIRDPRRLGVIIAVIAMLPVCNLVPLKNGWFGVRYLSHAGLGLALALGALLQRGWSVPPSGALLQRRLVGLLLGLWLVAAGAASFLYHLPWKDSATYFERCIQEHHSALFYSLLSNIRLKQGRPEETLRLVDEAMAIFPRTAGNFTTRGIALSRLGRDEEALEAWKTAEALAPDGIDNLIQLAFFYDSRYAARKEPADRDLADHYYQRAGAGITTNSAVAVANRGLLWMMEGDYDKAVAIWEEGLRRFPGYEGIRKNLEHAAKDPRAKKRSAEP